MEMRNVILWLTSIILTPFFYSLAGKTSNPALLGLFLTLAGICVFLSNYYYRMMYKALDYEKGYKHGVIDACEKQKTQLSDLQAKYDELNDFTTNQAMKLLKENEELKAQVEEQRCKNAYVTSDKYSNVVPCYTVYNCKNCSRKVSAE